jgi:CheY-like chemotaxis protein
MSGANIMPPVILVASDDTFSRLALAFHFADVGLKVVQAVDSSHARELLESGNRVDVVVMNIDGLGQSLG